MTSLNLSHAPRPVILKKIDDNQVEILGINISTPIFLDRMVDLGFSRKHTRSILYRITENGIWMLFLDGRQMKILLG
jgi:hypothetical protein